MPLNTESMIGSHYDLPVDTRPTTLQELAERLSERSIVLPLVYHQLNGVLILEGSTWRFFTGEEASH